MCGLFDKTIKESGECRTTITPEEEVLKKIEDEKFLEMVSKVCGLFDSTIKECEGYWTTTTPQEQKEINKIKSKMEEYRIIEKQLHK